MMNGHGIAEMEQARFTRQIKLVGKDGQRKLQEATVMIAGIGGLGGTAAIYLAAAGIGRLILAHEGEIALPDLNRQILMDSSRVGEQRMETAIGQLQRLNPDVCIEGYPLRISYETARPWVESADIVIDARYDFPERYVLNSLCVDCRKPMVESAMYGFELSLTTVVPGETPCLTCIYPHQTSEWEPLGFPVLGATSGIAGCLAAMEAIKYITGIGEPFLGVMYRMNTLNLQSYTFGLQRDPNCNCCGTL
ncbi:molybdopterin/thiamine biosynthesis adenylyltransferase [Paenibacillus anaericanus]|uniref:HesA/MoeB/ThiF family protein n=1 Tax=Paenibacillus anaericanus TaxID=170367 RepID=UPI002785E411|nr:HesA/MoeB/ThiF family protein [Paenibacillus anaericanus]MDQ0086685.1 molybdopterin/thiamine biosynthesis adenylyltransferase [Paenibacillus anaericanus]